MKTVQMVTSKTLLKAIYYDPERGAMSPNTVFVHRDGSIAFEINEVGLKGDPIDPERKLAVVWGDSVVFGLGRSWPCLLEQLAPGYQFLNGGIEGDPYKNILRRAGEFNRHHPVALNLLMLGWHTFLASWWTPRRRPLLPFIRRSSPRRSHNGNEDVRAELAGFLERTPNTVVLTMPTALNRHMIDRPVSAYLVDGNDDTAFRFFGDREREIEGQREAFAYILERNAISREVCRDFGIRLVDLYVAFDTEKLTDFRQHFSDILHLRARSYPLVAEIIYGNIKDLLA